MVDRESTRHYWRTLGEFVESGEVHPSLADLYRLLLALALVVRVRCLPLERSAEIASPTPPGARARVRFPCSPALHQERRRAATATAPPCRWSRSTVARRARSPPKCSLGLVARAKPAPPRRRPCHRRERARADQPAPVEAWQGHMCKSV
jgi:hypothetical protein